jgi:hypothetical protein
MPSYKSLIEQLEREKVPIVNLKTYKQKVFNTKENIIVQKNPVSSVVEDKTQPTQEPKAKVVTSEKSTFDQKVERIKNASQKVKRPTQLRDKNIVELW